MQYTQTPISAIMLPDGSYTLPDQYTGIINFSTSGGVSFSSDKNTIDFSPSPFSLSTLTGNSGGSISPTSGNINIQGVGSISVAGTNSTLSISSSIIPFTWNNQATTTTMTSNNGYIVTSGSQVFTLPATSLIGDAIEILLNGGTSWRINQDSGQSIIINTETTTIGTGGSITSTGVGQAIRLICVEPNTKWQATSLIGNPTVS